MCLSLFFFWSHLPCQQTPSFLSGHGLRRTQGTVSSAPQENESVSATLGPTDPAAGHTDGQPPRLSLCVIITIIIIRVKARLCPFGPCYVPGGLYCLQKQPTTFWNASSIPCPGSILRAACASCSLSCPGFWHHDRHAGQAWGVFSWIAWI